MDDGVILTQIQFYLHFKLEEFFYVIFQHICGNHLCDCGPENCRLPFYFQFLFSSFVAAGMYHVTFLCCVCSDWKYMCLWYVSSDDNELRKRDACFSVWYISCLVLLCLVSVYWMCHCGKILFSCTLCWLLRTAIPLLRCTYFVVTGVHIV
jgi:hypothetical protein